MVLLLPEAAFLRARDSAASIAARRRSVKDTGADGGEEEDDDDDDDDDDDGGEEAATPLPEMKLFFAIPGRMFLESLARIAAALNPENEFSG